MYPLISLWRGQAPTELKRRNPQPAGKLNGHLMFAILSLLQESSTHSQAQKWVFSALVAFIRRQFKLYQHQIRGGWVFSKVPQVSPALMTNATVKGSIFSPPELPFPATFCPVQMSTGGKILPTFPPPDQIAAVLPKRNSNQYWLGCSFPGPE